MRLLTHAVALAVLPALAGAAPAAERPAAGKVIVGYVFPRDRVIDPAEIAAGELTHVNYAFANVVEGRVVEGSPSDPANLKALTSLRASHRGFKVLVSVGGWTWSGGFSAAAATPEGRARFVTSAVELVRRHDLDGFDVDWEYPGLPGVGNPHGPQDKHNFTLLMTELRAALDREARARGRACLLTMAAGAFPHFLENTEMAEVAAAVDLVNLMTYDFREAGADALAGHHANLYPHPADDKGHSADGAVKAFLAAGVPARKLVLGVPFYGRAWAEVGGDPKALGLYQRGREPRQKIETSYDKLAAELVDRNGYARHWDPLAQAPFLWNPKARVFVSYEDPESLRVKCRYVREHDLAGVMFWEYYADGSGSLLRTLDQELGASRR